MSAPAAQPSPVRTAQLNPVRTAQPSLVRTVTLRLLATSILAILLHLAFVGIKGYLDVDDLMNVYVTRQSGTIAQIMREKPRDPAAEIGQRLPHYAAGAGDRYAYRVVQGDGRVVAEHNSVLFADLSPWIAQASGGQDVWLRRLDPARPLHFAGGLRHVVDGRQMWIEVATRGDPAGVYLGTLASETLADVWLPLIPLIAMLMGMATFSVRRALRPLVVAARAAETLTPLDPEARFDTTHMPREAASLASAMNGLLDRVQHVVTSQRQFIARGAHELRTPLAVMLLEIGRSGDPNIRRLEGDIRAMSDTVDHLLTLAQIESMGAAEFEPIDLQRVAEDLIARRRRWIEESRHTIDLVTDQPCQMRGSTLAITAALSNLIENAVRHTPAGCRIRVAVGPGARLVVEDDGPGVDGALAETLFEPFRRGTGATEGAGLGLAIVRQSVELHNGTVSAGRSALGGARFEIRI